MKKSISEHAKSEFDRRQKIPFWNNSEVYLATPEDVIIKKLSFYREGGSEKHLKDIRGIMAEAELDKDYLQGWIQKLGLASVWGKL